MDVVLITHFDVDAVGGAPDRGRGIESGLVANGHNVERLRLPVRKPVLAPRHLPWWYLRPSRAWAAEVRTAASAADLVIASYLPTAVAAAAVLGRRRGFIYDAHNDEQRLARQFRSRRATRYVGQLEERVLGAVDAVWIAGEDDRRSLRRRFARATIHNVPNGAPVLRDMSGVERRSASAYVYGSWEYQPNQDGLLRLAAAATRGRGRVHVFGRMPARLRREVSARAATAQPDLKWSFDGFAETLESMVEIARGPALLPVWQGGGTKLRAVQIAALGVPLISTSEGVSGLPEWFRSQTTIHDDAADLLAAAMGQSHERWVVSKRLRDRAITELSWERLIGQALAATLGSDEPGRTAP